MRLFGAGVALFLLAPGAMAMDAEEATSFLQGAWRTATESWIFEGENWQQFNGGSILTTTFKVEGLPLDMFIVISGETGRRYVVHANREYETMSWFIEGETQSIGFYARAKD